MLQHSCRAHTTISADVVVPIGSTAIVVHDTVLTWQSPDTVGTFCTLHSVKENAATLWAKDASSDDGESGCLCRYADATITLHKRYIIVIVPFCTSFSEAAKNSPVCGLSQEWLVGACFGIDVDELGDRCFKIRR